MVLLLVMPGLSCWQLKDCCLVAARMGVAGAPPASAEASARQGSAAGSALTSHDPADTILQHVVHCLQASCILADRPVMSQQLPSDATTAGMSQQPGSVPMSSASLEAPQLRESDRPVANGTTPEEAALADAPGPVPSAAMPLDGGKHAALTGMPKRGRSSSTKGTTKCSHP